MKQYEEKTINPNDIAIGTKQSPKAAAFMMNPDRIPLPALRLARTAFLFF
jgi:hypothetical protein